jgi:hypothetical protein
MMVVITIADKSDITSQWIWAYGFDLQSSKKYMEQNIPRIRCVTSVVALRLLGEMDLVQTAPIREADAMWHARITITTICGKHVSKII